MQGFLIIAYALLMAVSLSYIFGRLGKLLDKSHKISVRKMRKTVPVLVVMLIVSLLLASVYPSLSGQLEQGNASTPFGSALPSYYYNASTYLVDHGGYPAIVFPQVNTFNSNTVNNVTWYNGVNIYPGIIYSPSVSNSYPLNYIGGKGSVYSILANIYNPNSFNSLLKIDSSTNFSGYSDINGAAVAYSAYLNGSPFNDSVSYLKLNISTNFSGYSDINGAAVAYSAYLNGSPFNDSVRHVPNGIEYSVNKTQYHSGGQWLIGSIDHVVNMSSFTYLTLNYSSSNVSSSSIELGLFNPNGAGSWYNFNSFPIIRSGNSSYVVVNIKNPTINGGGSLKNISNVIINYNPANSTSGRGNIIIHGYSLTDQTPTNNSKNLIYSVNKTQYHSGGQWLIGSIDHVVNMSSFTYLTLNYSSSNVSSSSIELGLFNPNGAGSWYNFNSFPIIRSGNSSYVVVNIKNPTINGGGSLKNISNVIINYNPGRISEGEGTIVLDGFSLTNKLPTNNKEIPKTISQDMNILGIRFAYVDTSIDSGNGTYYKNLFSSNVSLFSPVFHEGSVYIYRNNAYTGIFSTMGSVKTYSNETSLLKGLYDSSSSSLLWINNSNVNQISGSYAKSTVSWSNKWYSDYTVNIAKTSHKTILFFKTDFNLKWNAYLPNGTKLPHIEVDGYANGYVIPENTSVVLIKYSGLNEYKLIEMLSLTFPVLEFGIFAYAARKRIV